MKRLALMIEKFKETKSHECVTHVLGRKCYPCIGTFKLHPAVHEEHVQTPPHGIAEPLKQSNFLRLVSDTAAVRY